MTNRILLNNSGLKITKSTYDVLTETNPNNFILRAVDNVGAGVFMSGSVTGVTTSTISFGTTFSYIPFTLIVTKGSGENFNRSGVFVSGLANNSFTGTVSTTNLILSGLVSTSTYYYSIFYMKAR